jgi:hypothetical protein
MVGDISARVRVCEADRHLWRLVESDCIVHLVGYRGTAAGAALAPTPRAPACARAGCGAKMMKAAVLMLAVGMVEAGSEEAAGCTFQPHCDYGKGSRESAPATTQAACCTLCSDRPGCAAGVFDGKTCWFKTAAAVKGGELRLALYLALPFCCLRSSAASLA